jgi:hypothetical protein
MLFHVTFRYKTGTTHDDQKAALKLFENWQPPAGVEITSFFFGADSTGFALIEAESAEALLEATSIWAGVLLDYDMVPVVPVETAVETFQKAIAYREATL